MLSHENTIKTVADVQAAFPSCDDTAYQQHERNVEMSRFERGMRPDKQRRVSIKGNGLQRGLMN